MKPWQGARKKPRTHCRRDYKGNKVTLVQHTKPIDICTYNNGNGRAMSLYGARLCQGSEIVREYLPCYRKSDGEIGLMEMINGQFIPSQVVGGFTKGADIEWQE